MCCFDGNAFVYKLTSLDQMAGGYLIAYVYAHLCVSGPNGQI